MKNKYAWIIVIAIALVLLLALPIGYILGRLLPGGPIGMMDGWGMMDGRVAPLAFLTMLFGMLLPLGLLLLVIVGVVALVMALTRTSKPASQLGEPLPPAAPADVAHTHPHAWSPETPFRQESPIQDESILRTSPIVEAYGTSTSLVQDDPLRSASGIAEELHTPANLEQARPCASCGKTVQPDWNNCPYCGHQLR
jgi:hypothetical protein